MVALGIGLGSPLVGFLSGGKVELGLVPIGALGMIVAILVAALALDRLETLVVCLTLIGFFTGFYIVPLFTLLQHRAPKTSKGDAIATSNFINVTGAIVSSVLFFLLVAAAHVSGITPKVQQTEQYEGTLSEDPVYEEGKPVRVVIDSGHVIRARAHGKHPREEINVDTELIDVFGRGLKAGDAVIDRRFRLGSVTYHRIRRADQEPKPFYDESGLPRLLFVGAASLTLFTLLLLWRQMPDLFVRMLVWLRTQPRFRLEIEGLNNLPDSGPAIVVTNARGVEPCLHVVSAIDRTTRFVLADDGTQPRLPWWVRLTARWSFLARATPGANGADEQVMEREVEHVLARKGVVGLAMSEADEEKMLGELAARQPTPILPIWYESAPVSSKKRRRRIYVLGGRLLPAGSSLADVHREMRRVAEEFRQQMNSGEPLHHVDFAGH